MIQTNRFNNQIFVNIISQMCEEKEEARRLQRFKPTDLKTRFS
jgi:hypothetical protein